MEYLLMFFVVLAVGVMLWCLFGLLLMPVFHQRMVTLCYTRGDGAELEQTVRSYSWLRDGSGKGSILLLVDYGLNRQGLELAQKLEQSHEWVICCPIAALDDCLGLLEDRI